MIWHALAWLAAAAWGQARAQAPGVSCAPTEIPVKVTYYSTVRESDFGDRAVDTATWTASGSKSETRVSAFAPGFAGRDSTDPKHPGLSGVAMEGAGWIDISLHQDDEALKAAWAAGYRVLVLEAWDEARHGARFSLSKRPEAAYTDAGLNERSAAVKSRDALFKRRDEVEVRCPGRPDLPGQGRRVIDDECSSCEEDAHLDLYVPPDQALDSDGFSCCAKVVTRAAKRR